STPVQPRAACTNSRTACSNTGRGSATDGVGPRVRRRYTAWHLQTVGSVERSETDRAMIRKVMGFARGSTHPTGLAEMIDATLLKPGPRAPYNRGRGNE